MTGAGSVYVAYWSLQDPLAVSQALPIVRGLAAAGWPMTFVTFEQKRWRLSRQEAAQRQRELALEGIRWVALPYHKWPLALSTVYDITRGALLVRRIAGGARLVHGRGTVAGAIALAASRMARRAFFYDADGPLSQEYVDAGIWPAGSFLHRLTTRAERCAFRSADRVAVLTRRRADEIACLARPPIHILPCAVDTDRFCPRPEARKQFREQDKLTGVVLAYTGKCGGWHLVEPMLDYALELRAIAGEVSLLVLSHDPPEAFAAEARRRGLHCVVRPVAPAEVPAHLAAADVGLSFRKDAPSQRAASPIKIGEYLACGLPVVITLGTGDYEALLTRERTGVVVDGLDGDSLRGAARCLQELLKAPDLPQRCRAVALREVDLSTVVLPRYREIYRSLIGLPPGIDSPGGS